jgi:hypothetical protein
LPDKQDYQHSNSSPKQLNIAKQYLFVREIKYNRSTEIDSMNYNANAPLGASWCASFGYWCLDKASIQYPQKKSPLARSHVNKYSFNAIDVIRGKKQIKAGYGLIWQKGSTIYGHFAFAYEDWNNNQGKTIEGNTSPNNIGSQDNGDGVYIKFRKIEPFNYFRIKWITIY